MLRALTACQLSALYSGAKGSSAAASFFLLRPSFFSSWSSRRIRLRARPPCVSHIEEHGVQGVRRAGMVQRCDALQFFRVQTETRCMQQSMPAPEVCM